MPALIGLIAILADARNTVRAGANATLGRTLGRTPGQPVLAALTVSAVDAMVYLAAVPFVGLGWPGASRSTTLSHAGARRSDGAPSPWVLTELSATSRCPLRPRTL